MVSLLALVRVELQVLTPLLNFSVILMEQLQSFIMAPPPSLFPRNSHLGRFLIFLVIIRWLVPVLDPVFIFRIVILFSDDQRNVSVSLVRVPLSGVSLVLGMVFQRLNDGKG